MEFFTTSRLEDLFSTSTSKNYRVDVLSQQAVTVEVMNLRRSMLDDHEGFIFKHFNALCNLLRRFKEYDESLKISALKVLIQVLEKMISSLPTFFEDEEFDKDELSNKRNSLKMTVFLLCQFINAFNTSLSEKVKAANIGKGRKKATESTDCPEWPEQRVKFVVTVKKLFKLPVNKLWDPPSIEPQFVNIVTATFFRLLEIVEVSKDQSIRLEIFRLLGIMLKDYPTGLDYSGKIIHLLQDYEHTSSTLAEGMVYFLKECSADTLMSDTLREVTSLDVDLLTQNLTAAHSLSQFLISVSEEVPDKFIPHISLVTQLLEWESHVMRNCALSILGVLLSTTLCSETLSEREKRTREELLEFVEAHVLDGNSFVRSRSIQVLKKLMEEKAVASVELLKIGNLISRRLRDKACNVRRNAMSFMAEFIHANPFASQMPLSVLKESHQSALEKLNELEKNLPSPPASSRKSADAAEKTKAVIFDDSDDDEMVDGEENQQTAAEQNVEDENNPEAKTSDNTEDKADKEVQEKDIETESNSQYEAVKKQQTVVNYLKLTMNFSEVIHGIMEPIQALLYSSTQTDVLEAIEFMISLGSKSVKGSDSGIKEVLKLVWSKEMAVKQNALNAFKNVYLSEGENECEPMEIAKNLIELLKGSNSDDALNVQECVKHFLLNGKIPKTLTNTLLFIFSNPTSEFTDEMKISILQLLGMLAQTDPQPLLKQLDNFIDISLGTSTDFWSAAHIFKTLGKINHESRGKISIDSLQGHETHLPHNHLLVSRIKQFLIDGIKNFEDDQWSNMANEAVFMIFSLVEEPIMLCSEISTKLAGVLSEEMKPEETAPTNTEEMADHNVPHMLLARFLCFCGFVAVHYDSYMKIDHFANLRRQEARREKRRRRSSINANVSAFQSNSFMSPPIKTSKKRKSFNKKYQFMPPVDEETTLEQILEMCANDVQNEEKIVGLMLPFVIASCRWTLKVFNKEVQAAASLSLAKFMLLSEQVCQDNMQLFATIAEKSPEAHVRANMIIAMGDLTTTYPNVVEPWTQQIFQGLKDSDSEVRENSITILTHLILHDFVRIKSLISDAAKCIADTNPKISSVAKYLFAELSQKGNLIYNIIPDIISSLSDPLSGIDEEIFQNVLGHMLQYVEKEKLVEGLVQKLCCRFTDSSTQVQIHEITFCLSILTLNDKCFSKLMELKNFLKERMSDPVVMRYINKIIANAKKNDAKTAAELERFRNELGI